MKRFTPYLLAYLIVATCTAIYPSLYRPLFPPTMLGTRPADSVVIVANPGIPRDELVARLQKAGLSEEQVQHAPIVRPAPVATTVFYLVHHFAFDAVIFAAFAGLVIFFQRKFSQNISNLTLGSHRS